jgi:hypothetical protein
MFIPIENAGIAMLETLLVSIPESLGVLVFGIGFTSIAILARRFFDKTERHDREEKTGNEA